MTKEAHRISVEYFSINNKYSPPQPALYSQPQSGPNLAHYSFDFAQQVGSIEKNVINLILKNFDL